MKPRIFISAVSSEFKTTRQTVANILQRLGYEPVMQEVFGTESGSVRGMLREKIDSCQGLVQIVGTAYGFSSSAGDSKFGAVSYTQYEFLYARKMKKMTWLIFAESDCSRDTPLKQLDLPTDPNHPDPLKEQQRRRKLQKKYREKIKGSQHLFHLAENDTRLELIVERMKDEVKELQKQIEKSQHRGWVGRLFIIVLLLLIMIGGGGVWWSIRNPNKITQWKNSLPSFVVRQEKKSSQKQKKTSNGSNGSNREEKLVNNPEKKTTKKTEEKPVPVIVTKPWGVVHSIPGHTHSTYIAYNKTGDRLISASYDGTMKLWDVKTGTSLKTFHQQKNGTAPINGYTSVDIDATGKTIATAHGSYGFRTWNVETGKSTLHQTGSFRKTKTVYSVRFHPDGSLLALANHMTVQLWDMKTSKVLFTLEGLRSSVNSVAFNRDGSRLAAVSSSQLSIWDVKSGPDSGQKIINVKNGRLQAVAFSPDGKQIAIGGYSLSILDAITGKFIYNKGGQVSMIAFSPDGKQIATGYNNGRNVYIWNAKSGHAIQTLRTNNSVKSVKFSPDSRFIAAGGSHGDIEIWRTAIQ